MTVKVVVTGSYREQESYEFVINQKDRFEQTAKAIGRKLATEKYILLVSWSEDNLDSQFNRRTTNQVNHPYDQTADYHALEGYLETIQKSPNLIEEGAKVEMRISGREGIACNPFNKSTDYYRGMQGVNVDVNIPSSGFPEKRSNILEKLASEADVVIIIGGGKATKLAWHEAANRQVLLPLGFAGGIGQQAIEKLSKDFKEKLKIDLNTRDVNIIIDKLPTLINLITSRNTSPNQTPETLMTPPPPNNGNNESSDRQSNPEPSDNLWSFLKSLPPWLWVIGGLIVIVLIYLAFTIGRPVQVTTPGGTIDIPKNPETSDPKEPSAKEPDAFKVKSKLSLSLEKSGKNSQPVNKATVKTFINGQVNSSEDTNTDGYVSFSMKSTDEVKVEIVHLDARDVPIKDDVKLRSDELDSKQGTIDRESCLLFAKDKGK